ncbi:MAG TPA: alpha/beta fold hydrolase [Thermoleophilaceae bacterium]|jgi:pimeloyl-ACP methyl ester carboxylesterase|nr:alpha/beta fold hydrolase [Thermoleophilaceae bacterium]
MLEVYGAGECFGRRASAFVTRTAPLGATVRYRLGVDERDRYGRALAYVWLADGRFLNRLLVARGYAEPLTVPPNIEYEDVSCARRRARGRLAAGCGAGSDAAGRLAAVLRHVTSSDGVRIACEVSGQGPPVVLVHGAGSARWSFDAVRPLLESSFTVIAIDRRGHGDSTDAGEYELRREYEDVAAVVQDAGEGAVLMGHSYGGLVAAGAAGLLDELRRLALYEPPMGGVLADPATIDRWERLIEEGDRDPVVREFLGQIGGYDQPAIDEMARTQLWDARKQVTPTLPRELRAELAHRLDCDALAAVTAPALLLVGTESPGWATHSTEAYADVLPNAEKRLLEGQGHGANVSAPELLAGELTRFLSK